MTIEALRWIARVHGVVAWLAAVGLAVAAARSLRRGAPDRARRGLGAASAGLLTAAFAAGLLLDAPYRGLLRQRVFLDSSSLGWLFERKTHLAFGALFLAWCALALDAVAGRARRDLAPWAADLPRAARLALSASAALALLAAIFSAIVTQGHPF